MTDDELTDAWQTGERFPGGITHGEHLRIAWVLHRHHGALQAEALLISGTRRSCAVHGVPDKFDEELTRRWSRAITAAVERDGFGESASAFIEAHPELARGNLFGGR